MSHIGGAYVQNGFGLSQQLEFKSNSSKGPQYQKTEELGSNMAWK